MTPEELADALRRLGHRTRVRRGEVLVAPCTFCGNDRWNLEANARKGVYHAWCCGSSGTVRRLLTDLGGDPPDDLKVRVEDGAPATSVDVDAPPTRPLREVPSAAAYLRRRGVSAAEAAVLGMGVDDSHGLRIQIPLREYWDAQPCGYVGRAYAGDHPKYWADVSCPYSLPGWRTDYGIHVLVEGPFDALTARRAGFGAAMLLGVTRHEEATYWAGRVPADETVVVVLDGEAHERAAALYHTLRVAHPRVGLVSLPDGQDPADAGTEELRRMVLEASVSLNGTDNRREAAS